MELKDYLRILRRRWPIPLLSIALFLSINYAYTSAVETQYFEARSVVLLPQTEAIILTTYGTHFPTWSPEYLSHETKIILLTSEPVLEEVVKLLAPKYYPNLILEEKPTVRDGVLEVKYEYRKAAVTATARSLKGNVSTHPEKGTERVTIVVRHQNGDLAVATANLIPEAFGRYVRDLASERLNHTREIVRARIEETTTNILKLKKKVSERPKTVPTMDLMEDVLRRTADEVSSLISQREALAIRIDCLERELRNPIPQVPVLSGAIDGEGVSQELLNSLNVARNELAQLERKYHSEHPTVIDKKKEIEALEKRLDEEMKELPNRQQLRKMFADLEELSRLREQKEQVDRQYEAIIARQKEQRQAMAMAVGHPVTAETVAEDLALQMNELALNQLIRTQHELEVHQAMQERERVYQIISRAEQAHEVPKPASRAWPLIAVVGLIFGVGTAYLWEYMSTTIRTEHDIKRYLNLPLFGVILKIRNEKERLLMNLAPKAPLSEIFNTISTLIEAYAIENKAKSFMVASPKAAEGKSTIATNLAVAFARAGQKVLIVDCDLRRSVLHKFFGLDNSTGLSTILAQHADGADAESPSPSLIRQSVEQTIKQTDTERLYLLTAGPHPHNPVSMLKSKVFDIIIKVLREMFDIILLDVPPINIAVDTLVLSPKVDAVFLLIAAGETTKEEATNAKKLVESSRGTIAGVMINKATIIERGYYYYYYYHDYYKYYRER